MPALLHKFRPALIPWEELVEANDPHRALETAFSVAQKHFGVERLMDPEDLADARRPDEKIVCCYVSFLFQAIGKLAKQDALVKSIRKVSHSSEELPAAQARLSACAWCCCCRLWTSRGSTTQKFNSTLTPLVLRRNGLQPQPVWRHVNGVWCAGC